MCHTASFVGTEGVEVVPAIWMKNGVCLWPPYKGEGIERATKCWSKLWSPCLQINIKLGVLQIIMVKHVGKLPLAKQQTYLQSEAALDSLMPPKHKMKCIMKDYQWMKFNQCVTTVQEHQRETFLNLLAVIKL